MNRKPLLGKIILKGTIRCMTGLHIGGSDSELAIGGIDSTVIRDPLTQQPYIPGSSLKGKLRCLLERTLDKTFDHSGGSGVYRHECTDPACHVCRLFGSSAATRNAEEDNLPARIMVRDAHLTPESLGKLEKIEGGLPFTEWKTENGLDRITCAANPRQIERVPAGAEFAFEMVYTVEATDSLSEDLSHVIEMLALLEDDALGGGGSRGNGRISVLFDKVVFRPRDYYLGKEEETVRELGIVPSSAGKLPGEALAVFAR